MDSRESTSAADNSTSKGSNRSNSGLSKEDSDGASTTTEVVAGPAAELASDKVEVEGNGEVEVGVLEEEEEEEAVVEESATAEDVMKALLKAVLRAVVKTAVREEEASDSSVVVVVVVGLGMLLMEAAKDAGEGTELVSDDVGGG